MLHAFVKVAKPSDLGEGAMLAVTVAGKEVLVAQGHELLGVKRDDNGTPVAVDAHGEGGGEAAPGISLPLGQEDL